MVWLFSWLVEGLGGLCRNSNWAIIDHTATPTCALHLKTKHTKFHGTVHILKQNEKSIWMKLITFWSLISAICIPQTFASTNTCINSLQPKVQYWATMSRSDLINHYCGDFCHWICCGRVSIGAWELDWTEALGTIGANGATWIQTFHWILLLRYYVGIHTSHLLHPPPVLGQNLLIETNRLLFGKNQAVSSSVTGGAPSG